MKPIRSILALLFAAVLALTAVPPPATAAPPRALITVPAVQDWRGGTFADLHELTGRAP